MPLNDFTGKIWKVIQDEDNSLCKKEAEVTFLVKLGESNDVTISCSNKPTYVGTYDKNSDTIKGNGYEISIVRCIKYTPATKGLTAGSWTAEDQGPWPGDE